MCGIGSLPSLIDGLSFVCPLARLMPPLLQSLDFKNNIKGSHRHTNNQIQVVLT